MNKIYKVKKNAAGHLVACSEFAKGHTKKVVLGSLLIVGILGMATTASAQQKQANGAYIGSGVGHEAKGKYSFVGSGVGHEAKGDYSFVGGGNENKADGTHSTIGGGDDNTAEGMHSTIVGGRKNQAQGRYSTVAGGYKNEAKGENSTVAGGYDNRAIGKNSFAAGVENKANAENAVVVGKKNSIDGENSVAIGSNNTVEKGQTNVFILGSGTTDVTSNSVLLGNKTAGKQATTVKNAEVGGLSLTGFAGVSKVANGVVSVGSEKNERQIVNVGAGEISATSTDAVNGSQLHALATVVAKNKADIATNEANIKTNGNKITNLGTLYDTVTKAVGNNTQGVAANKADIGKNKADIKANSSKITNLGTLHSMVAGAVGANKGRIDQNKADIQDLDAEVGLLGEEINSLEGEIFNNQDAIAKNQADIKTLESNVEEGLLDLSGRLLDQKADIANNIKNIYELAQQQDQHSSDIKTLKNNVEEGLLDLSGRLIDQKADIAKNQADIQLHDKKITNLGILHSMVARAVGNNTQGVATNKADIAKNQADIANNIKNIYELAQQQDQHSSDIKTLAKVSAANTDRIAKNKAEADASFETLTKNQNTLIEQGEALVEQNKAINQELEGFAAHADVQDKQILQNQADITTNKTAIEQNINRTVANGFEIEKNKAGIATNKQELILQNDRLNRINETNNRQDQKIDQLGYALKEQGQHFNNRISAVERQTAGGIANAIAIATLPSPSRAGEHHVLFGSGYHNGQAAVSLGAAGLSDTGKSTYKIGLSWSDAGGLSGGVGGSYRWK